MLKAGVKLFGDSDDDDDDDGDDDHGYGDMVNTETMWIIVISLMQKWGFHLNKTPIAIPMQEK